MNNNIQSKKQIETFNRQGINQKAFLMLSEINEKTSSDTPYCFQLVLWGIEKAGVETDDTVQEMVNAMAGWSPQRIANFLFLRDIESQYDPRGWEDTNTPVELARLILQDIENKIFEHFPWYRYLEW